MVLGMSLKNVGCEMFLLLWLNYKVSQGLKHNSTTYFQNNFINNSGQSGVETVVKILNFFYLGAKIMLNDLMGTVNT